MIELKKPTEEEQSRFNFRIKSETLRNEFALGNIFFNERKGFNLASEFALDINTPETQKKHKATLVVMLKTEGFSDCGEIYGYNKI